MIDKIIRHDKMNLGVKSVDGKISYCGNSPFSLAHTLLVLSMADYKPEEAELRIQIETLQLWLVSTRDELIKLIEEARL